MKIDELIGYDLQATQPVTRYQGDLKTIVDVVDTGSIVGSIYSWIVSDGQTWLMLNESYDPTHKMWVMDDPARLLAHAPSGTVVNVTTPGILTDLFGGYNAGSLLQYAGYGLIAYIGLQMIKGSKSK